ncbi:MAG: 30S ribosomal protein S8 [Candidatus Dojkabacteria bacterium]|nr:MAG: 30S ribosomal protein S8 [Candidatus Dojkabacteria bacterium]
MNDTISDFLTRIRNSLMRRNKEVRVPSTNMLVGIAEILKREGFILDYEVVEQEPQNELVLRLKYVNGEPAIRALKRISKPGVRKYRGYRKIRAVKNGMGVGIYSTPKGLITDKEAKQLKVGGEYICEIY